MKFRHVLRGVALAIAVAALVDPAITRKASRTDPITVVAADESLLPTAAAVRDAIKSQATVRTSVHDETSAAAACPAAGACVLVSSGSVPQHITAGAVVAAVVQSPAPEPMLADVEAPERVHPNSAATLRVSTHRPAKRIDVFDGPVLVGSAEPGDRTTVDVPWVPAGTGARVLRVVAGDDVADTGVVVDGEPATVLFYEPRVTWLGTYVRRALQDDSRFALRGRARVAPPVSVSRGDVTALSAAALDDVNTVLVTAPDMLSAADVELLERFVAVRGGSLVVLTDQRPTGASMRLLPRVVAEQREMQPQMVGPLRATEWLTFESAIGIATLAGAHQQPVVVSRALGRGQVIVSGALDAWRFRDTGDGFQTFWTTLAWDASVIAGSRLRLRTEPAVARPGEEVRVNVELQEMTGRGDDGDGELVASGELRCNEQRTFVRLWPAARPGTFHGVVRGETPAECIISVTVENVSATAPVTFRDDLERLPSGADRLQALAAAHGASLFHTEDLSGLGALLLERLPARAESLREWPMRSPFWLLLFTLCVGGEWWLRRQSGLS
jgi:hypothetical protein